MKILKMKVLPGSEKDISRKMISMYDVEFLLHWRIGKLLELLRNRLLASVGQCWRKNVRNHSKSEEWLQDWCFEEGKQQLVTLQGRREKRKVQDHFGDVNSTQLSSSFTLAVHCRFTIIMIHTCLSFGQNLKQFLS